MPFIIFNCSADFTLLYFFEVMKAPRNVAHQTRGNRVLLRWNPPEEGGGARKVERYVVRWSSSRFSWLQTKNTSATILNLQSSTRYTMRVYANAESNNASQVSVLTSKYLFYYFRSNCNAFSYTA